MQITEDLTGTARTQIRSFCRRSSPRFEAKQHTSERELRLKDMRLWPRPYPRPSNDGLCVDTILPRPRDYAYLAKVRR